MKKLILPFAIVAALGFSAVTGQNNQKGDPKKNKTTKVDPPKEQFADIQFEEDTHEFGNVKMGPDVTYEFKFKNTGNIDLVITNASAGCGCTSPEFPKEPIKPGKTGVIRVTYHTSGRPGAFTKNVEIDSNAKSGHKTIYIKGFVEG